MIRVAGGNKHDADDERLLSRAEEALTEIKVSKGLSERHEVVLAALRIRLKGDAGSSLEDLLAAAEDAQEPQGSELDNLIGSQSKPASSFDDLLSKAEKPKPSLDELLGSSKDESEHPHA